ncbi:MAG TPA: hypothetical protein VKT29_06310 [Terriglobales bacterium]|nr:hypothetical protein [Terriglobales bacterium]
MQKNLPEKIPAAAVLPQCRNATFLAHAEAVRKALSIPVESAFIRAKEFALHNSSGLTVQSWTRKFFFAAVHQSKPSGQTTGHVKRESGESP